MENMVNVTNRDSGYVGYAIPDRGIRRNFAPGETKKISIDELKELSYLPGGEFTLRELLVVGDSNALDSLNIEVEPEYFYTEEQIKDILFYGSLDQLEDTLNFAPEGVINLIKQIAVEEKLPDVRKRDMISKMTGFNINNAILVNQIMDAEPAEGDNKAEDKPVRKANGPVRKATAPAAPERKAELPKYKVTTIIK